MRVFADSNNPVGGWVLRASDIAGLSQTQIRDKFSLPQTPAYQVDVNVPSGQRVRASTASSALGNAGGGVQFEILGTVRSEWLNNPRRLP